MTRNLRRDVLPVVIVAPPVFLVRFGGVARPDAAIGRRAALRWFRLFPALAASWSSPWVSARPTALIVLARLARAGAYANLRLHVRAAAPADALRRRCAPAGRRKDFSRARAEGARRAMSSVVRG